MNNTVLHISSSANVDDSVSRKVGQYLSHRLAEDLPATIVERDLVNTSLPLITQEHIGAFYTPREQRSDAQKQLLEVSDQLVGELKAATHLVIGAPMYNFSVPASLKAWVDLICRVGETFVYEQGLGPKGLADIRQAYIVTATGGTPVGSDVDFASAYMQQVCRFIGVDRVHIVGLANTQQDAEGLVVSGRHQVDELLAAA